MTVVLAQHLKRVRKLAGVKPARARTRVPRQQYPRMIESEYAERLIDLVVRDARRSLEPLMRRLPDLLASAAKSRRDSDVRDFAGYRVVVENPRGSVRQWIDSDGTSGETVMVWDYGYLVGYEGADGDEVDVYLGPSEDARRVYVVHQMKKSSDFTEYDEDKVMMGFDSAQVARVAYLAQYDDPRFFGRMTEFSSDEFRGALKISDGRMISRADADEGAFARRLIDEAKARATKSDDVERLSRKFAERAADYHKRQLNKQVRASLGVDVLVRDRGLASKISHFASENVSLIRSLQTNLHDRVEQIVTRAIVNGTPKDQVAREIEQRFEVSESHARLIARDQIGKLYGQINVARQQELGVTRFVWRTVGDERVRSDHADREGNVYSFDDPPDGELPGEPIQCRCTAEPVMADILPE